MKCFKSLSSRLKLLTLLWVTAAVGSIVLTLLLSWRLEGGAAAINDAGSLRMQTYRLGLILRETGNQAEVDDRIRRFDETLHTLQTGDPAKVAANYAERSILLPTVSNKVRLTKEEKEDYFHHFLENKPVGKIDFSHIDIGCNTASDAGIYTFTYGTTGKKVQARYSFNYQWDGKNWLISQHHSSAMPEKQ